MPIYYRHLMRTAYLKNESLKLFLYKNPKRVRVFSLLSSTKINDDFIDYLQFNTGKQGRSLSFLQRRIGFELLNILPMRFSKLVNILSACSPLDRNAALKFVKRYSIKNQENNLNFFEQAWNYYKDRITVKRITFYPSPQEKEVLNLPANFLETTDDINEVNLRATLGHYKANFLFDYSLREVYGLIYKALINQSKGPKLTTLLQIIGYKQSVSMLREASGRAKEGALCYLTNKEINLIEKAKPYKNKSLNSVVETETKLKPIIFEHVAEKADIFARSLLEKKEAIVDSLSDYECYHVVLDEIERSVEFLKHIHLNKEYFQYHIRGITTFLPLNQPLYATTCFGIVPSLMAENVSLRPPTAMHAHYKKMWESLDLSKIFPNLYISYAEKEQYLAERAPITDAIIFTGTPENGNKVRRHFLRKTLFILNGAGHNPLVVTEKADIQKAIQSALRVVLYNQGQDCAGPNAILVHKSVYEVFKNQLIFELELLSSKAGPYQNRKNIVGPNSDPDHPLKLIKYFNEERKYCIYGGELNPITGLIRPTVFIKPLIQGGNYKEFFAPVFYLQPYDSDEQLSLYFDNPSYHSNAMYVTLFGESNYISSLVHQGRHNLESILHNTDLHIEEKGYLPYGGQGPSASCLYVDGKRISGATLPQRDIYFHLVKPWMEQNL